ncbi:MAG TPA: GntR family transcriptional regulator [Firmicutes bacterium]|nr:GntR family transcriptional regulator [Bacillota bacterium]
MQLNTQSEIPIYLQIAAGLEDGIFIGAYPEETQVPSTTELSVALQINPATVLKGINRLVEEGILYKKRGVGMFVSQGAQEKIREKRQDAFFESYIRPLVSEAKKLGLSQEKLEKLLERGYEE